MSINIEELTARKTSESFPNVIIRNPNDNVPVIVRCLEKGDMQLIMEYKGQQKVVDRISQSAINIDRLLRVVGPIAYRMDETHEVTVESVADYLSCIM